MRELCVNTYWQAEREEKHTKITLESHSQISSLFIWNFA